MKMTTILQTADFSSAASALGYRLRAESTRVAPTHWQGRDVSAKPEMVTRELMHVHLTVNTHLTTPWSCINTWQKDIQPNLPWADDHFDERVSGAPLNPGTQWANWPYAKSADTFRDGGMFNHTYMERFWPRFAGQFGALKAEDEYLDKMSFARELYGTPPDSIEGIRSTYGDLADVVSTIAADPLTRQAFLPVWFPEDTGLGPKDRKPCTLGYHFMIRDDMLHVYYPMRSCDFVRHFRDDCYLAIRLALWVIEQLKVLDYSTFSKLRLGTYSMFMSSLHVFANDLRD